MNVKALSDFSLSFPVFSARPKQARPSCKRTTN